jgi:hypothetical protein
MNHKRYSYLMNLNKNIINFCKYESYNFNTECWIIKKKSFSKLNALYIYKNIYDNQVKCIKLTNIFFLNKKNMIKIFENNTFLVYWKIKNN